MLGSVWFQLFLGASFPPVSFLIIRQLSKCSYQNWYHRHFHIPQLFQLSSKIEVYIYFIAFFYFSFVISWNTKFLQMASSWFGRLAEMERFVDQFVSQNPVFFNFHSVVRQDGKVHYSAGSLLFLLIIPKLGLFGGNLVICFYLKISENLERLILQDGF